jgi:hypothetical protein
MLDKIRATSLEEASGLVAGLFLKRERIRAYYIIKSDYIAGILDYLKLGVHDSERIQIS